MYKILLLSFITTICFSQNLTIALQSTSGSYNTTIHNIINKFKKKYPDTTIKLLFLDGNQHKKEFRNNLDNGIVDIATWQGGQRLFDYKNKVQPLNDMWKKYNMDNKFDKKIIVNIKKDDNIYGLPISYYHWGFYYNKKVFKKYNLKIPNTWEQLLQNAKVLKDNNIIPFSIGAKNFWTSSGWFTYLNLRVNGLNFHRLLLDGKISYKNKKVLKVFEMLKEVVDNQYFIKNINKYNWIEPMPYLYRQKASMTLIGNFFSSHIPKKVKKDIGFFKFPLENKNDIYYEQAPLDIFVISKKSKNKELAKKFLNFFSSQNILEQYNKSMGQISPMKNSIVVNDNFLQQGLELLQNAKGLTLFFDLDTKQDFANEALKEFTNFLIDADINKTTNKLEILRLKYY